jgi:hypothetical protein
MQHDTPSSRGASSLRRYSTTIAVHKYTIVPSPTEEVYRCLRRDPPLRTESSYEAGSIQSLHCVTTSARCPFILRLQYISSPSTSKTNLSMTTPALHSISSRLTTTQSLLLERQRILTLSLPPSASSTAQIVRNLTSLKTDLEKIQIQVNTEEEVLSAAGRRGVNGKGKRKGKGEEEGELGRSVRELEERFDRLVGMLGVDEIGRDKARELRREVKRFVGFLYDAGW